MGMQMWKTTESKSFGNGKLIEFLQDHGAVLDGKPTLEVPPSAFKAALEHPEEAGLTEEDIAFIKAELSGPLIDGSDASDCAEDETPVDVYDLC
jgi:hypothetical protein